MEAFMPMKPHKGESQSEFMHRCVPEMMGDDKRPQEQAIAACMSIWRQEHGGEKPKDADEVKRIVKLWSSLLAKQVPTPDDDEGRSDFLSRCVDEIMDDDLDLDQADAEDACELAWEGRKAPALVQRTHVTPVNAEREFILSDDTPDRMGDIILAEGFDLTNFKKNPIALGFHIPSFVVGSWKNLRVEKGALRGHLELAPEGTSPRIDEIRRLVEAGILRAVSVGFRPIESRPRKKSPTGDALEELMGGMIFTKSELVETSLVSIPANPNALAVAKSLDISRATLDLVFAGHGNRDDSKRKRGSTGGHADTSRKGKGEAMSLAQRIQDTEAQLVSYRDKLAEHLKKLDDSNVSDADLELTNDLNAKIAQLEKHHGSLVEAEKRLAGTVANDKDGADKHRQLQTVLHQPGGSGPIIVSRKKELDPLEYIVRAGVVTYAAKAWGQHPNEARVKIYGEDEATRVMCDMIMRAASAPAMTTVTGWAAELVQTVYADFMPLLLAKAIYARLAAKGLSLSFGRAGKISIPTRSPTPTVAGSFVGEGNPIPVRQGAFTAQVLVPKKMAVITTWTREIGEHSVPAIEGLLREAVREDTSVALDSVLIDAGAATAIRPAGLLNGVAALTATNTTPGFVNMVGDLKLLTGALTANLAGNIRAPAWLMNPGEINTGKLTVAPNSGEFPFKEELEAGQLLGYPVIDSGTVPVRTVILIDAADFVTVGGEAPRFDVSDSATLHMEDTTPLPLATTGTPAVVAAPQRSLWQTDSLALRMILPINWIQRRTGTVAWMQLVNW
jgi:HK97 family phage major capsid protein